MTITPNSSPPVLEEGEMKMGSSQSQPVLAPESATAGEWIKWNGGPCPVDSDAVVEVRCRDGSTGIEVANWWTWDSPFAPIVAYRLVLDGAERVHEQVSPPIRADLEPASLDDRAALREEVERLRERDAENHQALLDADEAFQAVKLERDTSEARARAAEEALAHLLTDEAAEQAARAHDEEDAAQKGEPSPWTHFNCSTGDESATTCPDCQAFTAERIAAMRAGLVAAFPTPATKDDSHE